MKADEKKCPQCAEAIKKEAIVCKHCGYRYTPADLAEQKKRDEDVAKAAGEGCMILIGLLVVGTIAYSIFASDEGSHNQSSSSEIAEPNSAASTPPRKVEVQTEAGTDATAKKVAKIVAPPTLRPLPSMSKEVAGEGIATAINLNGLLCAKVIEVNELRMKPDVYEVTCIEYRGGKGRVEYIVDANTGVAYRR